MLSPVLPLPDPADEAQVRAYFGRLEREYPQLIEAMRVMNVTYSQYLALLRVLSQVPSISTSSTRLNL